MEVRLPKLSYENLAKNLEFAIDVLGVSKVELSERTGIALMTIDQILAGTRKPDLEMLCAILSAIPIKFERLVR